MIKVSAFPWVPPFAQGLVRDLRVRWALEEAGLAYDECLITPEDQASEHYRRQQPFGQVPAYEEDGLELFESGAIVLHIAERSEVLMPTDPAGRARTLVWVFAALNSIESEVVKLPEIDLFHEGEEWARLRRPGAVAEIVERLRELAAWLGERSYLEDRFTAGDLMMTTVLRILCGSGLLAEVPTLDAYRRRCEARPAFQRALAAQLDTFARHEPAATA